MVHASWSLCALVFFEFNWSILGLPLDSDLVAMSVNVLIAGVDSSAAAREDMNPTDMQLLYLMVVDNSTISINVARNKNEDQDGMAKMHIGPWYAKFK